MRQKGILFVLLGVLGAAGCSAAPQMPKARPRPRASAPRPRGTHQANSSPGRAQAPGEPAREGQPRAKRHRLGEFTERILSVQPSPGRDLSRVAVWAQGRKYTVVLDLSQVVYSISAPADRSGRRIPGGTEAPLYASLAEAPATRSFLSAATLALKAKQFDDGLVASVDVALEHGIGRLPAKPTLLREMLAAFQAAGARDAAVIVAAALAAGGMRLQLPRNLARMVGDLLAGRTPVERVPFGVYSWNKTLERIYIRDRLLHRKFSPRSAARAARALARRPNLAKAYVAYLQLAEQLTNEFEVPDLRVGLGRRRSKWPDKVALFPASRTPETDLLRTFGVLPGRGPVSGVADTIVRRIRRGRLSLKPRARSGWYIHQLYALQALLRVNRLPEGRRLHLDRRYKKVLAGLFKALFGLTRETHARQVAVHAIGFELPSLDRGKLKLIVPALLDIEPLVTYYERRAASYAFVRKVLERNLGPEALRTLHRLTQAGSVAVALDRELEFMEDLFKGAALQARRQLGMAPSEGQSRAEARLAAWWRHWDQDPDLRQDLRMMVPLQVAPMSNQVLVWAVLGVSVRPLSIGYRREPRVLAVYDAQGSKLPTDAYEIKFVGKQVHVAYPVSVEIWVRRLMDRPTFRRLCDEAKTYRAIVARLGSARP